VIGKHHGDATLLRLAHQSQGYAARERVQMHYVGALVVEQLTERSGCLAVPLPIEFAQVDRSFAESEPMYSQCLVQVGRGRGPRRGDRHLYTPLLELTRE